MTPVFHASCCAYLSIKSHSFLCPYIPCPSHPQSLAGDTDTVGADDAPSSAGARASASAGTSASAVVAHATTTTEAAGASTRPQRPSSAAAKDRSMTDLFDWSTSAQDLFAEDSRLASIMKNKKRITAGVVPASSDATPNEHAVSDVVDDAALPPSSIPAGVTSKRASMVINKRGSIESYTSHTTAPADNLSPPLSSEHIGSEVVLSLDERQRGQGDAQQPSSRYRGAHEPRLSNDTEYIRFSIAAKGNLAQNDHDLSAMAASPNTAEGYVEPFLPSTICTSEAASTISSHYDDSSSASSSSEFRRFRSEAAGFGKRNLIADAVAGLDRRVKDNDEKGGDHNDTSYDAGPPSFQPVTNPTLSEKRPVPTGRLEPMRDLAPSHRQSVAKQQAASARQQLHRPLARMTDTTCTLADATQDSTPGVLDTRIAKIRPPQTIGTKQNSKGSGISSLTIPLEQPVPPYQQKGRMGRLLRKKKKKKAKDKQYRRVSEKQSSRDADDSRPRLSTVLSERLVTALRGSITSVPSARHLRGEERTRSLTVRNIPAEDLHQYVETIAFPRPSEFDGMDRRAEEAPVPVQSNRPKPSNADVAATAVSHNNRGEHAAITDASNDAHSTVSEGSSADLRRGDKMMLRWKQLGVDIATKQIDSAEAYYAKGDLSRARACYAQVAAIGNPLDGDDDDATAVLSGLVGEAKSMLVKIDSSRSLQDANDTAVAPPSIGATTAAASTDNEQGRSTAYATPDKDDIFASVHKAFVSGRSKGPQAGATNIGTLIEGELETHDDDPEARSTYSPKDIDDMANDLVSIRSGGVRSYHSSIASIDPEDVENLRADRATFPPGLSLMTSVGASDQVVIGGHPNKDDDTNIPTDLTLLQEVGAFYTVPMAPPSDRGLLASASTLTVSVNAAPYQHRQEEVVPNAAASSSQQSAGSDTSEAGSRPPSRSELDEEPPSADAEFNSSLIAATAAVASPPGEDTTEPQHDQLEQDAVDADEPVIYLRNNSSGGISVVSDMMESTASSWLKMQQSNPSRENSSSPKEDGTNPSLTIIGEELVIEDGLDPTEALKRASEQERIDQDLEKQVDVIEREVARKKEEKRSRRNAIDAKRLHDQGVVYYDEGDFEGARTFFASALKMRFQMYGQSSIDTCLTQEKLGDTLIKLDKIEEAHWQYLMAFRGLQQCNLPKDNPHTSRILVSLGDVFFSAADYSRALKYYEKSIRFCVESNRSDVPYAGLMKCGLGKYWPERNISYFFFRFASVSTFTHVFLAFLLLSIRSAAAHEAMAQNEWTKGEIDMCRFHVRELLWLLTYESPLARALFESKGALKKPSSDSQKFMVNTGTQIITIASSSEIDEDTSFSYVEESKALLVRKGSTPTDLDILRVLDSTTHIHAERGELINAYKCSMEKLTYLRSKFPNKNRGMAEAAYNVGSLCSKMGRHQEAITYYYEALTLHQRSTRHKDDEKIALLLKSLGSSYLSVKNPILALVYFKEHQSLCGMGGEKELLSVMGISRGKQFDLIRSLDCYAKVLDLEANEDQWLVQHNPLGPLIKTLEQIFASPKTFQAGQSVNEKARDCQDLMTILINLGIAQLIRNPATAQPSEYIKDIVHYLNEDGCIDGVDFTKVLFSMGNILLRRNRFREAIVYYEKCITSFTEEDRDASNDYVDLLTNLGTAYLRNGDHDKSFKHFRSALKEVKRARRRSSNAISSSSSEDEVDGLNHFSSLLEQARDQARGRENDERVLNLRHIIALYLCMDHRADEAVELLLDVERRMVKLIGEDHPDILQLRVDLSVAQLIAGSPNLARATYERAIGPVSKGRIPEYHPFYVQFNRLLKIHYPMPAMPVVAHQPIQPIHKPLPSKADFVPRMA